MPPLVKDRHNSLFHLVRDRPCLDLWSSRRLKLAMRRVSKPASAVNLIAQVHRTVSRLSPNDIAIRAQIICQAFERPSEMMNHQVRRGVPIVVPCSSRHNHQILADLLHDSPGGHDLARGRSAVPVLRVCLFDGRRNMVTARIRTASDTKRRGRRLPETTAEAAGAYCCLHDWQTTSGCSAKPSSACLPASWFAKLLPGSARRYIDPATSPRRQHTASYRCSHVRNSFPRSSQCEFANEHRSQLLPFPFHTVPLSTAVMTETMRFLQ